VNLNSSLFFKINGFAVHNFYLDIFAIFFAYYFEYIFIVVLLIFLFLNFQKYISIYWYAFLSAILARVVFVEIIHQLFYTPRPFDIFSVNLLIPPLNMASFPSGHASFYSAIAFYIFLKNKKLGIFALVCALLISVSRVFVGVHWPVDILGGFIVGLISALSIDKFLIKKP